MIGKEVGVLISERLSPGTYAVVWDASDVSSGVYFVHLIASGNAATRKMILMR